MTAYRRATPTRVSRGAIRPGLDAAVQRDDAEREVAVRDIGPARLADPRRQRALVGPVADRLVEVVVGSAFELTASRRPAARGRCRSGTGRANARRRRVRELADHEAAAGLGDAAAARRSAFFGSFTLRRPNEIVTASNSSSPNGSFVASACTNVEIRDAAWRRRCPRRSCPARSRRRRPSAPRARRARRSRRPCRRRGRGCARPRRGATARVVADAPQRSLPMLSTVFVRS